MTPLVVHRSRGWWGFAAVFSSALGAVLIALPLPRAYSSVRQVVVALVLPFCCVGAAHAVIRLLFRRPALRVDAEGIEFPELGFSVPWHDFAGVAIRYGRSRTWLVFDLATPDGLPRDVGLMRRFWLRAMGLTASGPTQVFTNGLSLPADRVVAEIEARRPPGTRIAEAFPPDAAGRVAR